LKDEESFLDDNIVSAAHGAVGILVDGALPAQHDVRPSGYEAREGDVLVHRGTRITPGIIGVIAGGGHDNVLVYRQVTVDVLVFGDELLTSGPSRDGKVRDSLGPQLPAWINQLGARLLHVTHVEDTLEAHTKAIKNSVADLIITTGGTAAGPVDHLHQAIVDCDGEFVIDAVMVRPGYHQLFAKLPGQFLLGLPGNPQSAVIGLLTLGDAFLRGSVDVPLPELPTVEMAVNTKAPPREIRLALCTRNGGKAEPVEHLDSSMLRGFVTADGYALVPAGGAVAGDLVRWLNLP
jgi:molybdopterin molybdotransferase